MVSASISQASRAGRFHRSPRFKEEHFVHPATLALEKQAIHERAIRRWAPTVSLSCEAGWDARERCIAALTTAPPLRQAPLA